VSSVAVGIAERRGVEQLGLHPGRAVNADSWALGIAVSS
jgi:hypothetical protein